MCVADGWNPPPGAGITAEQTNQFKMMIAMAYSCGWVTISEAAPPWGDYPTIDDLRQVNWDAEVTILPDPPGLAARLDQGVQLGQFGWWDGPMAQKVAGLVMAAKITQFTTKHHLGAKARGLLGNRGWQGYTEKYVTTVEMGLQMGDDAGTNFIHNIVHPASTLAVLHSIGLDWDWTVNPPRARFAHSLRDYWPVTRWDEGYLDPHPGPDARLRLKTVQAGCHRLVDLATGARAIVRSNLAPLFPRIQALLTCMDDAEEVKRDPLVYGESAFYYCGQTQPVPLDASKQVDGMIVSFVQNSMANQSLARAAVFREGANQMEGYSDAWNDLVTSHVIQATRHGLLRGEHLERLMQAGGIVTGGTLNQATYTRLVNYGLAQTRDTFNAVVEMAETISRELQEQG